MQQSAVQPVSALELLERQQERKHPSTRHHGHETSIPANGCTGTRNEFGDCCIKFSQSPPAPCLLQNPLLTLPLGCLTEIAGPAGAGKSQLALSMCADCVWQRPENKAVYISLGGSGRHLQIISRRLKGMLEGRLRDMKQQQQQQLNQPQTDEASSCIRHGNNFIQDCLCRIFVRWVCNSDDLFEMLHTSLPQLLELHSNLDKENVENDGISIVVLDGIADLFRIRDDAYDDKSTSRWHQHRAVALFQISNLCKELSTIYQVPFLVINGATSRLSEQYGKPSMEPALGLAWSQCVNCSYFVDRLPEHFTMTNTVGATGSIRDTHALQENQGSEPNSSSCAIPSRRTKVGYRRIRCLKAPNISSVHHQCFYIDQKGVIPA